MCKEPTQEQIKEFWEWCGFYQLKEYYGGRLLPIDLNNLFKYAVPLLLDKHTLVETYSFKQASGLYYSETCVYDKDERQLKGKLIAKAFAQDFDLERANALALFWAIRQVIELEVEYEVDK